MSDIHEFFRSQQDVQAVEELCRRLGASFVIDTARKYVVAKERAAAAEQKRWASELIRIAEEDQR